MGNGWRSTFIGLGAGIGITAAGWWAYESIIRPMYDHDEPVIIENGSAIVDFNPFDNEKIVGGLLDHANAQTFHRSGADPVKLVRVFLKKKEDTSYKLLECVEKHCDTPKSTRSSLTVTLSNGHLLQFHWEAKPKSGLVMYSAFPRFRPDPKPGNVNPYRYKTENGAGNPVRITGVTFPTSSSKPQNFTFDATDDVKIQMCAWDDYDHCEKYKP
ncbi:MAG: hypothetical protein JNM66_01975 [Bryobacterales bacterium]|nr:hypothetical protein [Bryobacterales bacterium]